MRYAKYAFLVLFVYLTGCETNPPTGSENVTESQLVVITSNIDSAKIYIDDEFTGLFTPDSLMLEAGTYDVAVEKDFYTTETREITVTADVPVRVEFIQSEISIQKVVLLEDFANTSCTPCVESNKLIEDLKEEYGADKLVSVKFPTNFPSPADPFYLAGKQYSDYRMNYYRIQSAPTIILDGTNRPAAKDQAEVRAAVEELVNSGAEMKINVTTSKVVNTYRIDVQIEIPSVSGMDMSALVLYTAITETDIQFAAPNGETEFYDVMRVVLPSNEGKSLGEITNGGVYNFQFEHAISSEWNVDKLNAVAYVQNTSSREILQAGSDN